MTKMFSDAQIVGIVRKGELGFGEFLELTIETSCPFNLSTIVTVPNEPEVLDQIDIPLWNDLPIQDYVSGLPIIEVNKKVNEATEPKN